MIPKSVRLIWSAKKSNVELIVIEIEQIQLGMQAVPLAGSILKALSPSDLTSKGTGPYKNK